MIQCRRRSGQQGYTLMPLLAMAGVAMASMMYVWAAPRDNRGLREQRTSVALALARDTLIGRAAGDDTRPGSLPCPDVDNDGTADGVAGNCTAYLGRLPWRTLGLGELRDGWGERLWYALSRAYRDNAGGGILNSDTPGAYRVRDASGAVVTADAPALVIAPGPALGGQSREAGNQDVPAMYLEGANPNGNTEYVVRPADDTYNDRVLIVGREELFRPVVSRVAKAAQAALDQYRAMHGYYPAANPYSAGGPSYYCDPATLRGRIPFTIASGTPSAGCTAQAPWGSEFPSWFFDNSWHLLTHYAVASVCTSASPAAQSSCTGGAGSELTISGVSSSARIVVIVSGPPRSGQARPCNNAADCLEDGTNTDGDTRYARPSAWPQSNDRMAVTCAESSPCAVMP